jgi:hypothetical protein
MDSTPRTAALRTAKMLIGSHGMVAHMNKYNRELLTRDVTEGATGLRYDFNLNPEMSSWSDANPSCTLAVSYAVDPKGARTDAEGGMVIDNFLRVAVTASGNDMTLETLKRREGMITMLGMLGEMLTNTLPQQLTLTMETAAEVAERTKRAAEQFVGQQIYDNLGSKAFKGLRAGGSYRSFRLTPTYASVDGKYPEPGTYRFRHVRSTSRNGRPKEVVHYSIRVYGGSDGSLPPTLAIRRVEAV